MAPAAAVAASGSNAGASYGSSSTICSVWECCRSILLLWEHLLEYAAPVAASRSIAGACCSSYSIWEQCWNGLWFWQHLLQRPRAFQACGSGSTCYSILECSWTSSTNCSVWRNARAFYCSSSTNRSVWDQCWSVVAPAAPVCSVAESCRNSASPQKQQL